MRVPVCFCLLLLVVAIRGQDGDAFDLGDALGGDEVKPVTKKPQPDLGGGTVDNLDGFNFWDVTEKPKKPTAKPQPVGGGNDDGDFDLGDALGGDDKQPTMKPQPGQGGGAGGGKEFDDSDLAGGGTYHDDPRGQDDKPSGRALQPSAGGDGQAQGEGQQSMVAGIVSAVAVAAVGAVSSFIAYQKKKLCFKGATDDPENVNMDSHKGEQSDPQAQSNLLAK